MYLNKRCWFLWAIRISSLAKSNDNSNSFFLWVVLLNLTIFWVRENNAFIFRTQKSVNIKAELFGFELSTNNSMYDFAWHGPGTFYMSVFTRRHGFHIGVPKQWNGGHVAVPNQSCGSWTISYVNAFFPSNNMHRCWSREWKRSIGQINGTNWLSYLENVVVFITINDCIQYN